MPCCDAMISIARDGLAFAPKTGAFGMVFLVGETIDAYIFRKVIFFLIKRSESGLCGLAPDTKCFDANKVR